MRAEDGREGGHVPVFETGKRHDISQASVLTSGSSPALLVVTCPGGLANTSLSPDRLLSLLARLYQVVSVGCLLHQQRRRTAIESPSRFCTNPLGPQRPWLRDAAMLGEDLSHPSSSLPKPSPLSLRDVS